jgi:hypothetical protein
MLTKLMTLWQACLCVNLSHAKHQLNQPALVVALVQQALNRNLQQKASSK